MNDGVNIYALSLTIPVIVSLFLAARGLRSPYAGKGRLFALLMFSIAGWSACYGLELSATTMEDMLFWLKLEYVFIPYVTLLMFLVVQQYAGLDLFHKWKLLLYLLPIPILTMVLSITNEYHGLYYKNISLKTAGSISLLELEVGSWYYVHVIFSYVLIVAASVLLIRKLIIQRSLFRNQLIYMLMALLMPAFFLSFYLLDLSPVQNIDPTPFAFTFTGLFMSVSVLRYRLLDLMPIARRHVFRSMTDGLVVVDVQNRIVDVNPEGVRIFNWDRMPYGEQADALWKDYPQLTALLKDQNAETIELEIANQQDFYYYLVSSSVIKDNKKRLVGVLLVIHDITFRHQMQEAIIQNEEKLRVLNAEKDKLFSVIAHDLRGPMGAFTALTELILQQPGDISADEMRHLMNSMNKSARSLQDLLENLLYWSRMQRDDVRIELKSLPPERFVKEVLSLFQESVRSKKLKVYTSLKPLMVMADEQMLLFVLRNLISNAIKFTPQGGVIHIKSEQYDDAFVSVVVMDTGIGMDKTLISKLFAIEEKVGRPGTAGEPSSGLGLILSKEFIARQNGKLLVESEPHKGSTLTVLLPLAKA